MSSQGDAGQFRTPRHIIDFIVDVVNPTKNDKVLDPACGTGGFLVSSYKHILEQHDGKDDPKKKEKSLTPDERKKLMANFEGYDIDPTMVRIAQVNMYLHQFKNPEVFQYDSLSSEERWNDKFDVILANPPFMTPKGGIRPHNRFTVSANRSEVLFVSYIMDHLNLKGRAGIIVPEGIIFQSANAYKDLRKKLIEDGLFAVVSLPPGVFNPYSGVKTSILLFDNQLTKRTKDILFIKIDSDGYDLGAQRRKLNHDGDLPSAIDYLKLFKRAGENNEGTIIKVKDRTTWPNAFWVPKEKISQSGDYNLSGDRYRETKTNKNQKWPLVELSKICDLQNGYAFKSSDYISLSNTLNIRMSDIRPGSGFDSSYNPKYLPDDYVKKYKDFLLYDGDLIIAMTDMASEPKILGVPTLVKKPKDKNFLLNQRVGKLFNFDSKKVFIPYLRYILSSKKIKDYYTSLGGGGLQINISKKDILSVKIPLPPLEIQKQIVEQIEGYQKIIDGSKQIISSWKPKIDIDPEWEMKRLEEICEINPKKAEIKYLTETTELSFVPMEDIQEKQMYFKATKTKTLGELYKGYTYFKENDVLVAKVTPCFENGKSGIAKGLKSGLGFGSSELHVIRSNNEILPEFIYPFVASDTFIQNGKKLMTGTGGLQRVPVSYIENFEIPLPPLEIQKQIVDQIEEERKIVEGNKRLIEIYEKKIEEVISNI